MRRPACARLPWLAIAIGLTFTGMARAGEDATDADGARPLPEFAYGTARFSGVWPHLASLADSYSEAGIGAVVPWADRLWYLSYVAHKAGSGVGLYEINGELGIRRRPESVVGTHASRMIHRETNQLIIGPYVIDAEGKVRVFKDLLNERLTGTMRHLTDPAHKVYFQAMEGNFYEGDLRTLSARKLYNLTETLGIGSRTHFKGGYTAQGRVVVANNSYFEEDQRHGSGRGRLAEWDGRRWTILERTAFCDATTAAGIRPVPDDRSPLWANGWDRRSVILKVLCDGRWTTWRLPKGSQSYDQAWCTEWPRIRQVAPGRLLLDVHGLYYEMSPDFRPGHAGGLVPYVSHLKMTPDFCAWKDGLVFAGNENTAMGHRHRTGGQPQANLWFGSIEDLGRWGRPAGWGGPWLRDEVKAGVSSDPFLIQGFANRVLHLSIDKPVPSGLARCTDQFEIVRLPDELAGLDYVTISRGSMLKPAPGYSFEVNQDVVVYLAVHDRGTPKLPSGWEKTGAAVGWQHGGDYTDSVYKKAFAKGKVEVPGHDGHNALKHYGVPHTCFVAPASSQGGPLAIGGLPKDLGARAGRQTIGRPRGTSGGAVVFTLEIDKDGSGRWSRYNQIAVPDGGYAWHVFPPELRACWVRITPHRDTTASAQFHFSPHEAPDARKKDSAIFDSLPPAGADAARIAGAVLPFAERLWLVSYVDPGEGKQPQPGGLYEIDKDVKLVRRAESIPGVFDNRKMVAGLLSIGPHLIGDDGTVRTFDLRRVGQAQRRPTARYSVPGDRYSVPADRYSVPGNRYSVPGTRYSAPHGGPALRLSHPTAVHVVSSIRHPAAKDKMYFLTVDGRLLEADLKTLALAPGPDVPKELGLADAGLRFKGGHTAGKTLIVAAAGREENTGVLAEWDGKAWKVIDRAAFGDVSNLGAMSQQVIATGWDGASTILMLRAGRGWTRCRLPKATADYCTVQRNQWPRVREVVTERMLVDAGGLFYEVSGLPYAWSVKPVTAHGRNIADFCSWRGLLVLAGADARAQSDANYVRGGQSAGLWFGTVDDLWKLGGPRGVGGPWLETGVKAGVPSDPYLMANFENKRVELSHDAAAPVRFTIEVDFTVQRSAWKPYKTITVEPGKKATHEFPAGYSAHWVRVRADRDCQATAWFAYE